MGVGGAGASSSAGGRAEPEVGEKRVQGDNVVERCREEGSRANKRDMTVSALGPLRFTPCCGVRQRQ